MRKVVKTQGVCAQAIGYEVENGLVTACQFMGGCPGNTQGVHHVFPSPLPFTNRPVPQRV